MGGQRESAFYSKVRFPRLVYVASRGAPTADHLIAHLLVLQHPIQSCARKDVFFPNA